MIQPKESNYKLKSAVNRLLFHKKDIDPPTRKHLMQQFKNIILTNKQLNHRFIDFNFDKEYKSMHRTMRKFNSEQNSKKNLVSKLSKENQFFTKSYPNIISSLAITLGKKNINYQTISNFNQKYESSSSTNQKDSNFFYEDPLLLTKRKDLDNFYINEKNINSKKDQSLNYSKRLLNNINSNSPLNRVLKIIEKKTSKNLHKDILMENLSVRNNDLNLINNNNNIGENQPLSDRPQNYFRNNKNILYNKYTENNTTNKEDEIKQLKKYNRNIKKLLNKNNSQRTYTEKNVIKFNNMLDYINEIDRKNNPKTENINNKKNQNVKFNLLSTDKNSKEPFPNKLEIIKPRRRKSINSKIPKGDKMIKDLEKIIPSDNKLHKTIKKKLGRVKKLKGSIQIQSIYKDLLKTKDTVNKYNKEKKPKFKYLYSIFSHKKNEPFQREETENNKIKQLDRELFWTVNVFHNN